MTEPNLPTPFGAACNTDIDLCVTGVDMAAQLYERTFGRPADTLFVGSAIYDQAVEVLRAVRETRHFNLERQFASNFQPRWWSVGSTKPLYGFGSRSVW